MDNNFLMPEYEDDEETPIFVPEKNEEPTVQLEEEVIQPASSGEMLMPDYNEDDIVNETEVAKDITTFKVPTVAESNTVLEKEVKENPPSRSAKLRYLIKQEDCYEIETDILEKFSYLLEIENLGSKL